MKTIPTYTIVLSGHVGQATATLTKPGRKSPLYVATRDGFVRAVEACLAGAGVVRDQVSVTHPGAISGTYTSPRGRTMRVNVDVMVEGETPR